MKKAVELVEHDEKLVKECLNRPICMKLDKMRFRLDPTKHTVQQNLAAMEFIARTSPHMINSSQPTNGLMELTFIGTEVWCRSGLMDAITTAIRNTPDGFCLSVKDFEFTPQIAVQRAGNLLSSFREWRYEWGYWNSETFSTLGVMGTQLDTLVKWMTE